MAFFGFWLDEIVFAMAAGFLAGVAAVDFAVPFGEVFLMCAVAACGVLIVVPRTGLWKLIMLIAVMLFAGMWYVRLYNSVTAAQTHIVFNETISFSAIISDEPKVSASGKYLVVNAELASPLAGNLTMLLPPDAGVQDGDTISTKGKIAPPSTAGDAPLVIPKYFSITAHRTGFSITATLNDFRAAMVRGADAILPADAAGFVSAVAFGAKDNLTPDTASAMASSGTAFLATLYGMKMSLLLFTVYGALLGYLDRRIVAAMAIAIMLAFAAMVGAPVAALRAAIMAVIALIAREQGGALIRRNAIMVAAAGMAAWNPAVLTDIGFAASFGSVIGILYLTPAIMKLFRFKEKGFLSWRENIAMNLAAQLAIIPLIVDPATGFPLISLISGAVLIIFLPLTMLAGWFAGFSYLILRNIAFIIAPFITIIANIQLFLIHFFAIFSFTMPLTFTVWTVVIYYGALIWFAIKFHA